MQKMMNGKKREKYTKKICREIREQRNDYACSIIYKFKENKF
jgi:hypothetical protein